MHAHGWLSKIRVPFGVRNIIGHLMFRIPKKRTLILTTTHMHVHVQGCRTHVLPHISRRLPVRESCSKVLRLYKGYYKGSIVEFYNIIGALIIRVGFWGPVSCNYMEAPQHNIGDYLGPYITSFNRCEDFETSRTQTRKFKPHLLHQVQAVTPATPLACICDILHTQAPWTIFPKSVP